MDILIAAGMMERKLFSKLLPITASKAVDRVFLVRRDPVSGDKIHCFSPKGLWRRTLFLAECYRVLSIVYVILRYRPPVVIGIGLILHGIYTNLLGWLFGRRTVCLLMGKNDLALTDPGQRFRQRLLLKAALLADFVGTRGTRSKDWLIEKGARPEQVFIPHNVFEFDLFFAGKGRKKAYDLIYVGLLSRYKRIDLLLRVVHDLVQNGLSHVRLAVVGEGTIKGDLKIQCKELGIGDNVIFLPQGDASYVCHLLQESRIFVMTSQGEGLPMAMLEALSCGVPVVVFDDADMGDVVRQGENGFMVPLGDLDGFVYSVKLLLRDRSLCDKLSKGALAVRERFGETYSLESAKAVWEGVLQRCQ